MIAGGCSPGDPIHEPLESHAGRILHHVSEPIDRLGHIAHGFEGLADAPQGGRRHQRQAHDVPHGIDVSIVAGASGLRLVAAGYAGAGEVFKRQTGQRAVADQKLSISYKRRKAGELAERTLEYQDDHPNAPVTCKGQDVWIGQISRDIGVRWTLKAVPYDERELLDWEEVALRRKDMGGKGAGPDGPSAEDKPTWRCQANVLAAGKLLPCRAAIDYGQYACALRYFASVVRNKSPSLTLAVFGSSLFRGSNE
jgi:hypothetical protein